MDGLKMYLIDQNMSVVESTVKQLKEQLDFDATAINQLQFAIYLYQVSKYVNLKLQENYVRKEVYSKKR